MQAFSCSSVTLINLIIVRIENNIWTQTTLSVSNGQQGKLTTQPKFDMCDLLRMKLQDLNFKKKQLDSLTQLTVLTTIFIRNQHLTHQSSQQLLPQGLSELYSYPTVLELLFLKQKQMLHKPTSRKEPKRFSEGRQISEQKSNFIQRNKQLPSNKKLTQKTVNQPLLPKITNGHGQKNIPQKVQQLEKAVQKLSKGTNQPQMQKLLLKEILGIKSELKEIKLQIGLSPSQMNKHQHRREEQEEEEVEEEEENITNMVPRDYQESKIGPDIKSEIFHQEPVNLNSKASKVYYNTYDKKQLLDIGKIQPYMKEFKLENPKIPLPIYTGYHKKSSKPVIIKYCLEQQTMQNQVALYQRLWKNIVKAKKICINKIYDLNQPMAHNLMALDMNKYALTQIPLPPEAIIKDVLRAMQFMHECGFIYRDLHPSHVMQSHEGNIVLLGLKRMKKFTDIKNRLVEVKANSNEETLHEFVSNSRLRGIPQGRKDDLQTLGYLAIFLLEGRLPWTINNLVQGRSKQTLQHLYGKYPSFFQFMVTVHKMSTDQQPNYDQLSSLIQF